MADPKSPSRSRLFGSFDSLSDRLDHLDELVRVASPPAIVMPIVRRPLKGTYFPYDPQGWDQGRSDVMVFMFDVSNFEVLPPWRPETFYISGQLGVMENGVNWTPMVKDGSTMGASGVEHPRFFRSVMEADDEGLTWVGSPVDDVNGGGFSSRILALSAEQASDGRVIVFMVVPGDNSVPDSAVLELGVKGTLEKPVPGGFGILQGCRIKAGDVASYQYDANVGVWRLFQTYRPEVNG